MVDRMLRSLRRVSATEPEPEPETARPSLPVSLPNGDTFDALDITDGHSRLIITRVPIIGTDGVRQYGTSVDTANLDPAFVLRLYRDAEVVVRDMDDHARAEKVARDGE